MNLRKASEFLTEVTVIALTVVVAYGLERLFSDRSYLSDLLVLAGASHLLAIVVRRAGFGIGVSGFVSIAGFLVVGNVVFFPETSGSIIPTRETFDLLRIDLETAWTAFEVQQAPVDPLRGFVATAGLALWWIAALADWAAFRLRSSLEAVVPAAVLFVFTVLLGTGERPVLHAALFAGAVGAVMLSMRLARQARDDVWIASGAAEGIGATLRVGAIGAVVALIIGAVAGPALPDAGEQLLDPAEWDNGPQTRFVTSPLVDINANLVNQSQFEMFSVAVDNPTLDRHYWRQMALTEFDGGEWRRSSNFDEARGPVGSDIDPSVPRRTVRQEITTRRLGGIYLPAAYEVSNVISSQGIGLEYEVSTGALVIERGSETNAARGFTYVIESAVPEYDPASLPADATSGLDADFVAQHTALPATCETGQTSADGCWNPLLTELAEEQTASATSDYERVLALQRYFLDPSNFTYDLNVSQDHDLRSMEDFLFIVSRGYCEQFASTFAALARSLGIPARVAVGFTWGDWDTERQEFIVRGTHAHAWPEVYFADVGWIVLDPTPGRAPAHNTLTSGLAEPQQFGFNDEAAAGTNTITPTTIPPSAGPDQLDPGTLGGELDAGPLDDTPAEPPATTTSDDGAVIDLALLARVLLAIAGVVVIVGAIPLLRWTLRRRRIARTAGDPSARTELAWDDATDALRLIGVVAEPAETPVEFATRAKTMKVPVGPVDDLADAVTIVRYADLDDAMKPAIAAARASAAVNETCRNQVSTARRWVDAMDPRTLSQN
ncbi:MAG: transglutaminaseTgpA domain-containing protein [Actinomycetota bacterium]